MATREPTNIDQGTGYCVDVSAAGREESGSNYRLDEIPGRPTTEIDSFMVGAEVTFIHLPIDLLRLTLRILTLCLLSPFILSLSSQPLGQSTALCTSVDAGPPVVVRLYGRAGTRFKRNRTQVGRLFFFSCLVSSHTEHRWQVKVRSLTLWGLSCACPGMSCHPLVLCLFFLLLFSLLFSEGGSFEAESGVTLVQGVPCTAHPFLVPLARPACSCTGPLATRVQLMALPVLPPAQVTTRTTTKVYVAV